MGKRTVTFITALLALAQVTFAADPATEKGAQRTSAGSSDQTSASTTRSSSTDTGASTTRKGAKEKSTGETASSKDSTASAHKHAGRLDINTATKAELEELPGVGPATAEAIISARPFNSIEDLKRINGIGDTRFAEIRPKVMVSHTGNGAKASSTAAVNSNNGSTSPSDTRSTTHTGSAATKTSGSGTSNSGASSSSSVRHANTGKAIQGKVNINTASKEQLDALPGIGPVKAQAIIDARPFKSPEDVMKVRGIKQGEYSKIKDLISVQ